MLCKYLHEHDYFRNINETCLCLIIIWSVSDLDNVFILDGWGNSSDGTYQKKYIYIHATYGPLRYHEFKYIHLQIPLNT